MSRALRLLVPVVGGASILAGLAAKSDSPSPADVAPAVPAPRPIIGPATRPLVELPPEMDVPTVPVPPSPALEPADALKTFKVAPGFHVELVAAEPLVEDPVCMAFDADGRLWVCEMRGYMPHLDPGAEEDKPVGRIVVLENTHGKGFDKKTIFLDHLVLPRAVTPFRDGVLVASPPYAWFCRDINHDGKCDEKDGPAGMTVITNDYTQHANPEHEPNGMILGIDNWIWNADYGGRFRYEPGAGGAPAKWIKQIVPAHGQWGISQDDVGRMFYNYNSDLLRGDLIPAWYVNRNPNYGPISGSNFKVADSQEVFPARPNPGVNRGYQPAQLRTDGTLRTVTATCAPYVYRGDLFPADCRGNIFIPEPAGNLIKRMEVKESPDGTLKAKGAYDKADFLTSTDERFRPVALQTGPDGALYVCDLYRGVLQHQRYITPYLRKQILTRDLVLPIHRGRIYRVVPDGAKLLVAAQTPGMTVMTSAQLVENLSNPSGWWRDTAQRLLVEHAEPAAVKLLLRVLASGKEPLGRLHALYTLEGMKKLDEEAIRVALADADYRVRIAALRLAEPMLPVEASVAPAVLKLEPDSDARVRLQFLLTASTIDSPEARQAIAAALTKAGDQAAAREATFSGLRGRELPFLEYLLSSESWSDEAPGRAALIGGLAWCILKEANLDHVQRVLALADPADKAMTWQQSAIIQGMAGQIGQAVADKKTKPVFSATGPVQLPVEPPVLLKLNKSTDAQLKSAGVAIARSLNWPGKPQPKGPVVAPLTTAQKESFDRGKTLFGAICAACHQPDGAGLAGKAPSMHGSDLLLGSSARPMRVVLQGLRGPVTINGEIADMEMPTLAVLSDEQIADTLTYIRREWGHTAAPVAASDVTKLRAETAGRGQPWTRDELQAMKFPDDNQPAEKKASEEKASKKSK